MDGIQRRNEMNNVPLALQDTRKGRNYTETKSFHK